MGNQVASNSIAIRWTKNVKICLGLVNAFFALFGLRMVRMSRLRALHQEQDALHREREALIGRLKNAHRVQEALASDLYSLRAKTDAPQMSDDRSSRLSIIIPTMNSESYIGLILKYYRDLDVETHVLVDAKTNDKELIGLSAMRVIGVHHAADKLFDLTLSTARTTPAARSTRTAFHHPSWTSCPRAGWASSSSSPSWMTSRTSPGPRTRCA